MANMNERIFEQHSYGKVALEKLKPFVTENFRLYYAGWLGEYPNFTTMEVRGAEFRAAKSGPNKGILSIKVPGTDKTAYATKEEMQAYD